MTMFSATRFVSKCFLILTSVLGVFGATGDVDTGFNPRLTKDFTGGYGRNVVIQPDGKMIIFGTYGANGGGSPLLRRLNADGTFDATFNCPACVSFFPKSVAVQPDGKIIVGGSSDVVGGVGGKILRVNQNGSVDPSFQGPFNNTTLQCVPRYYRAA